MRVDGPVAVGTRGGVEAETGTEGEVHHQRVYSSGEQYTDMTQLVTMDGPLALLWARITEGGFENSAQGELDRLLGVVEQP